MSAGRTRQEPEALFARLVARFEDDPAVTLPSAGAKFGASALKFDGKIFAMLSQGQLVVKLPKQRVEELVASRTGAHLDPGHGRVMTEWLTIGPRDRRTWEKLADEARQFVGRAASQRSGR
jgi:hypothetical protein